jgi:hypothetical protein
MGGRFHQLNSAIVRAALAIVRSFSSPGSSYKAPTDFDGSVGSINRGIRRFIQFGHLQLQPACKDQKARDPAQNVRSLLKFMQPIDMSLQRQIWRTNLQSQPVYVRTSDPFSQGSCTKIAILLKGRVEL